MAKTQGMEAEKPNGWPLTTRETRRREGLLPSESGDRPAGQEEQNRTSPIDYPDAETVKPVEPGGASNPNRPASWLAQLRPRWGKAKTISAHPPGVDKRDAAPDMPQPDVSAVEVFRTQGERPPSRIQETYASSIVARGHRQPVFRSVGAERERAQKETHEREQRRYTTAPQGVLRADALGPGTAARFSPRNLEEIAGDDRLDRTSDAAKIISAATHRSIEETSQEKTKIEISRLPPASTHPVHELPPAMSAMTGREAERFPAPVSGEAKSVESSCWPSLPDQAGKEGEALPWASLPDDVWTQPLQHAAIDRTGSPGHELYGPDVHKLSG